MEVKLEHQIGEEVPAYTPITYSSMHQCFLAPSRGSWDQNNQLCESNSFFLF